MVSHVMSIKEKMAQMMMVVRDSLERVQASQKAWYDMNEQVRTLNEGDMVLVLCLCHPVHHQIRRTRTPHSRVMLVTESGPHCLQ